MSIPKKIHYCWFGRNPLPESAKKCIESWKKYCPAYEIIEWNEDNFDLTENRYAREAYEQKKWAFVSDYARLKIVYEQGGIYMDVDVELIKPLDELTELDGYMGFEKEIDGQMWIATGLGFGARAGHPIVGDTLYATEQQQQLTDRLCLHAQQLSFHHPKTDELLNFECAVPF